MPLHIPALSIAMMGVSALICFVLPVVLWIIVHKKYGAKFMPAFVGALAFVLFVMVLESVLHSVVLRADAAGNIGLLSRAPWLYVIYGSLAAGVFEETARYLSFLILRKKYSGAQNALAYGIGHGGIEAMLLVGLNVVIAMIFSIQINNNAASPLITLDIQSLVQTPPLMFLVGALERIGAITIQIALSVLVYYAVQRRDKIWLYPLAILLHALVDVPAAMAQAGLLSSLLVIELAVLVSAVLIVILAVLVHRSLKPEAGVYPPQQPPPPRQYMQ